MPVLVGTERGLREVDGRIEVTLEESSITIVHPVDGGLLCVVDGEEIRFGRGGDWRALVRSPEFRIGSMLPSKIGLLVGTSGGHLWRSPNWNRGTWPTPVAGSKDVSGLDPIGSFDQVEG